MVADELKTFASVWRKAAPVNGWLSQSEAAALYRAACTVVDDGLIVEIGSFAGKSLTVLAESGREVLAVDPLTIGDSIGKQPVNDNVVESLQSVVNAYPLVSWLRCRSTEIKLPPRIDMLHIDACHKFPHPLNDFQHFEPALSAGAIVAFHDYYHEAGVTETIKRLLEPKTIMPVTLAGTMFIGRYRGEDG